jgi:hypothetical protein
LLESAETVVLVVLPVLSPAETVVVLSPDPAFTVVVFSFDVTDVLVLVEEVLVETVVSRKYNVSTPLVLVEEVLVETVADGWDELLPDVAVAACCCLQATDTIAMMPVARRIRFIKRVFVVLKIVFP